MLSVVLSCFLFVGTPIHAFGQQGDSTISGTEKATVQALLLEVRQLRLALERSASLLPRVQLATLRFQAQQDRVDRLSKELRDLRSQIAQHAAEKDRTAAIARQLESDLTQTSDPTRRKQLEEAVKQMPIELERLLSREQQDRAQEGELLGEIQREQTNLSALSDQLDVLDRQLQNGQPPVNQR